METNTATELLKFIGTEIGRSLEGVPLESSIEELGIDSLDFVSLMQAIGEKFKPIPEASWSELETLSDILKAVA